MPAPEVEEQSVEVMPRRKQRQLNHKVRIETAEQTAARSFAPDESEPAVPAVGESVVETEDHDDRDGNNMPRRSRRSPRHLRVSGQRRH